MSNPLRESPVRARVAASLKRRYLAERWTRRLGFLGVVMALAFLLVMLVFIVATGWSAFRQTVIRLDVTLDESVLDPSGQRDPAVLYRADYQNVIRAALRDLFPDVTSRRDKRALYKLISQGAQFDLRDQVVAEPALIGRTRAFWVLASSDADMWMKGKLGTAEGKKTGRLSAKQLTWLQSLKQKGAIKTRFNRTFFTHGDSREPELAGVLGATMGAFLSLAVCILLSFPLGVLAAIYLEELAPPGRLTRLIEVNINNLAAVPSIIFGILGLAVFINVFGVPRSAPLAGGMVLALMTLPTIVIAGRASLQAVPPSIREAALSLGASPIQAIFHHILPLALPGIMTGTIIGMARALGETAPLLMIGMVAFIVDVPHSIFDPSSTLPVQVYLWADSPERGFVEKTGAAIMVLLFFLIAMNAVAVYLRKKFEVKW